jgi:uncharacterized membrane protein YphA (DoxX/SURF4 family)
MNTQNASGSRQSSTLLQLDALTDRIESGAIGRIKPDVWVLIARIIFGLPLLMNGVGQIVQPELIESQMNMVGVSLAWKWPAILACLLGGLAIVIGWRVRLAAFLLIIYTVAATLLFHNTHTLVTGDDPLEVPQLARQMCEWYVYDLKKIPAGSLSEDFFTGCGVYRLWFDGAKTMDHFGMMIPMLLVLVGVGGGAYSVEHVLRKRRKG